MLADLSPLSPERLEVILGRAATVRAVVIGDVMLDVYLIGNVARISPEAPVPVVQVVEERTALGGAANVAANIAALGASCDVIGYAGLDLAGTELCKALAARSAAGVTRPRLVRREDRPTTTKTRVMARKQQMVRFDRERDDDLPYDCVEELKQLVREAIAGADVLILEDYNKGVLTPPVIRAALTAAEAAGIPTVVDPKFRNFFEYRRATVFKPNVLEVSAALGIASSAIEDHQLRRAREKLECEHLLVTLGEEGMVLCSASDTCLRIPAVAREVFDVSGAGDTVTACVAVALAAGASIEEAAVLANFAAAIEVGKPGVATVSPAELRELVAAMAVLDPLQN